MRKALLILWLSLALLLSGCGKEEEKAVVVRKNQPEKIEGKAIEDREELKKLVEPVQRNLQKETPKESPPDLKGMPSEPIDVRPKEFVQPTKFLADPLPNGVIFDDNLSVSITKMERGNGILKIWLAFRKISEDPQLALTRDFILRVVDDRGNKYEAERKKTEDVFGFAEASFSIGSVVKNPPIDIEFLPVGFTWIDSVNIARIPDMAPIVEIGLERRVRGSSISSTYTILDFSKPAFPNLDLGLRGEYLLHPEDEIQENKDISFSLGEMKVEDRVLGALYLEKCFSFSWPIKVKNLDYSSHIMPSFRFSVLFDNGRFIKIGEKESPVVYELPAWLSEGTKEIPASSTVDSEIRSYISLSFLSDSDSEVSIPRIIALDYGYRTYKFIVVSDKNREICAKIRQDYFLLEQAKEKLRSWCEERGLSGIPRIEKNRKHIIEFNDYSIIGSNIWAAGGRYLIYSSDSGNFWELKWQGNQTLLYSIDALRIYFFNEKEGLFITNLGVFETLDGGKKWTLLLDVTNLKIWDGDTIIKGAVIKNRNSMVIGFWWRDDLKLETSNRGETWELYNREDVLLQQTKNKGKTWQRMN